MHLCNRSGLYCIYHCLYIPALYVQTPRIVFVTISALVQELIDLACYNLLKKAFTADLQIKDISKILMGIEGVFGFPFLEELPNIYLAFTF